MPDQPHFCYASESIYYQPESSMADDRTTLSVGEASKCLAATLAYYFITERNRPPFETDQ